MLNFLFNYFLQICYFLFFVDILVFKNISFFILIWWHHTMTKISYKMARYRLLI